jgi:hypothetical protein
MVDGLRNRQEPIMCQEGINLTMNTFIRVKSIVILKDEPIAKDSKVMVRKPMSQFNWILLRMSQSLSIRLEIRPHHPEKSNIQSIRGFDVILWIFFYVGGQRGRVTSDAEYLATIKTVLLLLFGGNTMRLCLCFVRRCMITLVFGFVGVCSRLCNSIILTGFYENYINWQVASLLKLKINPRELILYIR